MSFLSRFMGDETAGAQEPQPIVGGFDWNGVTDRAGEPQAPAGGGLFDGLREAASQPVDFSPFAQGMY